MQRLILGALLVTALGCNRMSEENEGTHPNLILTAQGVKTMRANVGKAPLLDTSLETIREQVASEIALGIDVPMPKDLAGGYTHERHKANFFTMQKAGVLFQITQEEKYALYIKEMLLQYAALFPTFNQHPATRSYARGKFFWQCLNDANWLVYTSQAYDCIYDWLDEDTKTLLNEGLFKPYADYISIENPKFFNRLHNHSTWGNAAVGMIGLVMDDEDLIDRALYAFDIRDSVKLKSDNDGGTIALKGYREGGFLAQIDHSFSPDGYYTEGPYYQRYAMYPFLIFAQALATKKRELNVLEYRDGLLIKAVYALINQTNAQGEFFPINDAQKGMSLDARELVHAVSMAYHFGENDPSLLSIVMEQGRVPLNDAGLSAAKAIENGEATPYMYRSMEITDGANGQEGAIGILRADPITLVMKYAKHGMGHGHFDRLGFLLYDTYGEVIQDYGSARWVNIEHKDGGGYLRENHSWAKETIAHNTLVVNETSQFDHNVKRADLSPGTPYYFSVGEDIQIVSALEQHAYPEVSMHRTMAVADIAELEYPLVLDLFAVNAPQNTKFDLPLYYLGEVMSTNQTFQTFNILRPLGSDAGYQHLWKEGEALLGGDLFRFTWFNQRNFFTLHTAVQPGDKAILTRIGAQDPDFNLRRDPGLIHRRVGGSTLFTNLYERHGSYRYASEIPVNSFTAIADLREVYHAEDYSIVDIKLKSGASYLFAFSWSDACEARMHEVATEEGLIAWKGAYHFKKKPY